MTDTTTYKTQLTEEKAHLEEELSTVARENPAGSGVWEAIETETSQEADPNDQASSLDEYQENTAIADALSKRYQEVTAALERIENGSYGTCSVCGKEIEEERLHADPAANTCTEHLSS